MTPSRRYVKPSRLAPHKDRKMSAQYDWKGMGDLVFGKRTAACPFCDDPDGQLEDCTEESNCLTRAKERAEKI